jgi:DNA repair exonuclease SbcCD ATPase subunit
LFGVNAESYSKSVYIPQGEIETGGLPDGLKTRLLALLSTGGQDGTSAEKAIEKLDKAEKELRAKRGAKKGKLDAIEERLIEIVRAKGDCDGFAAESQRLRQRIIELDSGIEACKKEIQAIVRQEETVSRQAEREALGRTVLEIRSRLEEAKSELAAIEPFFNGNNPAALNVDGLEKAIGEFYSAKEQLADLEKELAEIEPRRREYEELQRRAEACEKLLDSYDAIFESGERRKKRKRSW